MIECMRHKAKKEHTKCTGCVYEARADYDDPCIECKPNEIKHFYTPQTISLHICGDRCCKFNNNNVCHQEVHLVARDNPMYDVIYNRNSEEVKQHCSCLLPDIEEFIEKVNTL